MLADTKKIVDKAVAETRSLSTEENTLVETNKTQMAELKNQITALETRDNLASQFDQETRSLGQPGQRKTEPSPTTTLGELGLSNKEVRNYSILRAINSICEGRGLQGLEKEVNAEIEKRTGKAASQNGFFIPANLELRTDVNTTTATGLVNTGVLYSDFISVLKNAAVCAQAGATYLTGLVGNLSIPQQTAGATVGWVTEGNATSVSNPAIGSVALTPKTITAFNDLTRKLVLQSSMDVEMFVRQGLATDLAIGIDAAALVGSGVAPIPEGILYNDSITTVDAVSGSAGGALAFDDVVALETAVANGNALLAGAKLGYISNTKVRGQLKVTPRHATAGGVGFILDGGQVNGCPFFATNSIPSNLSYTASSPGAAGSFSAMLFGNWADLIIALWGALEVRVDPYTLSSSGGVRVVVFQDADVKVRHTASFARMFDIAA